MAQRSASVEKRGQAAPRPMRPVDLVHLAKQCQGDETLEHEILGLFDTTLQTYFARLKLAEDRDDLALILHSIKGAASGVGAWALADLVRSCEAEMRSGRPLSSERIADLGMAIAEVRTFIARMLDNEPA